jgi:hypothetical protein
MKKVLNFGKFHVQVSDSSTVPRYILVRENMPIRGLGVDSYTTEMRGVAQKPNPFPPSNASDWGRVSASVIYTKKATQKVSIGIIILPCIVL